MKIIKMPIDDLISPDYNPRRKLVPADLEYQRIRNSIERWGYVDPIIFNRRTRHIVGGNQRWQVLRDLGHKVVDVVEVDLDDANEQALNVALNKITGAWDQQLLSEVMMNLNDSGFDLTLTGFDSAEVKHLLTLGDAPESFPEHDENVPIEHQCPRCGYRFSGDSTAVRAS